MVYGCGNGESVWGLVSAMELYVIKQNVSGNWVGYIRTGEMSWHWFNDTYYDTKQECENAIKKWMKTNKPGVNGWFSRKG